ncbi:type IV secretion system protein TrbL [Oxalobacteraceae bacterium GrIS 1.18]
MKSKLLFSLLLILVSTSVLAQQAAPVVTTSTGDLSIVGTVTAALSKNAGLLLTQATSWFFAFLSLQFVWTNIGLLRNGTDMEAIFGKLIGSLLWGGICIFMINKAPNWIDSVGTQTFNTYASSVPSVGGLITSTLAVFGSLSIVAMAAGKISEVLGNIIMYMSFGLLIIGVYFAFKVFMIKLELALIVLLSPLSFAFLGMNALKEQGIAPFKSLIAYIYKVIIFGMVFAAFGQVEQVLMTTINGIGPQSLIGSAATYIEAIGVGIASYILLGILLFKSDSIAQMLAGGHVSLGTSDVAGAAAAGAAVGAAAASGASLMGTAPGSTMRDFLAKNNSGSVSNASSVGTGGNIDLAPKAPQTMSSQASGEGITGKDRAPRSDTQNPTPRIDTPKGDGMYQSPQTQNGADAGISGANPNSGTDKENQKTGSDKKNFADSLSNLGHHVQQESAQVQVNISAQHDLQ